MVAFFLKEMRRSAFPGQRFLNQFLLLFFMVNLVVKTQVKDLLKEAGLGVENMSGDFMDVLDTKVKELVLTAVKRAKENGRRTVMGRDI